jgi:hypothetical protein
MFNAMRLLRVSICLLAMLALCGASKAKEGVDAQALLDAEKKLEAVLAAAHIASPEKAPSAPAAMAPAASSAQADALLAAEKRIEAALAGLSAKGISQPSPAAFVETGAKTTTHSKASATAAQSLVAGFAGMGYVPVASAFDNPATDITLTPTIPSAPDCTVRPQTVLEIQHMRQSASRIAASIETEVGIMHKRKAYVEQMTNYLNDRIRELNKVKSELAQEARWITVSENRINELAQREKLVKMQDILACLNGGQQELAGETKVKGNAIKGLSSQAGKLEAAIKKIEGNINGLRNGKAGSGASGKK